MWFAFLTSPLGPNLRILKKLVLANVHERSEFEDLKSKVSGVLDLTEVSVEDADMLYLVSSVDPDTADLIRLGFKGFIIAELK